MEQLLVLIYVAFSMGTTLYWILGVCSIYSPLAEDFAGGGFGALSSLCGGGHGGSDPAAGP